MSGHLLLAPAEDEVHLWSVALDMQPATLAMLSRTLAESERQRAARYRSFRDRARCTVARARLRGLLGAYLDAEPASIVLREDSNGKVRLAEAYQARLTFNVSHSRDLAVYAIGRDREVGVDVELVRDGVPTEAIARRGFAAHDRAALAALPPGEQRAAFFRFWTRHEARLKASGAGLSGAGSRAVMRWSVHTFHVRDGFAAAVAIEGQARAPSCATALEGSASTTVAVSTR